MDGSNASQEMSAKAGFCHDSLWEPDVLLNSSLPYFTDCFQDTVLVYVPTALLWLPLPFYLRSLAKNGGCVPLPMSRLAVLKMVLSALLAAITFILALLVALWEPASHRHGSPAVFLAYGLRCLSYAAMTVLPAYERHRHMPTSSVGFIFWFFVTTCDIVPLYSRIISEEFSQLPAHVCLSTGVFVLEVLVFLAHCPADHHDGAAQHPTNSNPEEKASFVNRLWFGWTIRTIFRGWRKELTEDDIFDLNPRDASDTLILPFEKKWNKEMTLEKIKCPHDQAKLKTAAMDDKESYLMREQSSLYAVRYSYGDEGPEAISGKGYMPYSHKDRLGGGDVPHSYGDQVGEVDGLTAASLSDTNVTQCKHSLLRVLLKLTAGQFLLGFTQKLAADACLLLGPLILSLLIGWADQPERQRWQWQGLSLAFVMLGVQVLRGLCLNWAFWTGELIGIHMKTSLMFAIYKKALTLNSRARQLYTSGEIINLMTVDCGRLRTMMDPFFYAWTTPVQALAVVIILYQFIGWSVLTGLVTLLLLLPLNAIVAKKSHTYQDQNVTLKDKRLQMVNEALSGIKVIKLYAWEPAFEDRISRLRVSETKTLFKIAMLESLFIIVFSFTPFLVTVVTFAVYLHSSEGNHLDPSKAFVTLSYFGMLREPLLCLALSVAETAQAIVSISRIDRFLQAEDLKPSNFKTSHNDGDGSSVDVEGATFTWDSSDHPTLHDISLQLAPASLCGVVGAVGSGKSSLMAALLGEMDMLSGHRRLQGSAAYVPQQAWIQNATIRDNILFGHAFHQRRYQQVLFACALEADLKILPAGDATEIGEKGINLSGGQKQRVSLARACYSQADLYLLDDPLSAVDSHVAKHIFKHVLCDQGLLRDKTRLLVSHGLQWLPQMDMVVLMEDGRMSESGSYESLMSRRGPLASFVQAALLTAEDGGGEAPEEDEEMTSKIAADVDNLFSKPPLEGRVAVSPKVKRRRRASHSYSSQTSQEGQGRELAPNGTLSVSLDRGKLVEDEKMESGKVRKSVYADYAKAAGICPMVVVLGLNLLHQTTSACTSFWLSHWTRSSQALADDGNGTDVRSRGSQDFYLSVYGGLGAVDGLLMTVGAILFMTRTVAASKHIHLRLLKAVLRCPMAFFDTTPVGRILSRFSKDIAMIDEAIPIIMSDTVESLTSTITVFTIISINTPFFLVALVPIVITFVFLQMLFLPTSRQLRRLESVSRSPIVTHLSESLSGAATIRAYGKRSWFLAEMKNRLDRNQTFLCPSVAVTRSISLYLDILSGLVIFGAAFFCVLTPGIDGATLALSVACAIHSSASLGWMVRQLSNLETNIICMERLKEYAELTPEADWIVADKRPTSDWPTQGRVEFKGFQASYRPGLDLVLKGITCTFKAGEKIGVVGRTGAGKSSLALSLFRLIEASQGHICVDGLDLSEMGLHDLRSRLTILPQDPVLFYGSLRMNLDPTDLHTDEQLWQALDTVHLKEKVRSLPQGLHFQVGEEGLNFSVGQRQLVCLARALLRKSRVLVLDEATAAVDLETDRLIQETIQSEFGQNCTVISIAHRLHTVWDCDRVVILENGQIKEMDSPTNLLADKSSAFYAMARDSNLVTE